MKTNLTKLVLLCLVSVSFAHAGTISAESTMDVQVLSSVNDMKSADYSKANQASAKVFSMVYGDGGLNTNVAYVIIQNASGSKGYMALKSISGITRATFSGMGELTLNYTRTTIKVEADGSEKEMELKESAVIKFSTKADGSLADSVEVEQ